MFFDFRCERCETTFEGFVKPSVHETECPECSHAARRLISAPHFDPKMGLDESNPTAASRWERVNKQKTAQDAKFFKEHGVDKKHHSFGS